MERKIIQTADGSPSVAIPGMEVTYHSIHGAITESKHVFIQAGLQVVIHSGKPAICILEIGLGTGLNALLTLIEAEKNAINIHYTAIEPHPLEAHEARQLTYCDSLERKDMCPAFGQIHSCGWNTDEKISKHFTLRKIQTKLQRLGESGLQASSINLVYFDAFAPAAQPELWSQEIFESLHRLQAKQGILVTYCSKGDVRRAMQAAGYQVEKIPGPPGKREMLRAIKI